MIYEETNQIEQIQKDIIFSTYDYFKHCDRDFNDFIFGDKYYQTLSNIAYSFICKWNIDYSTDWQTLGIIDVDRLVSDLYYVFIKAEKKYKKKYDNLDCRHKKNYIHLSLRRAAGRLLFEQYKKFIKKLNSDDPLEDNLKRFKYISFNIFEEGDFVEKISYNKWKKANDDYKDLEAKRDVVKNMMSILNATEQQVIELTMRELDFSEMGQKLKLNSEQIRKIFHRAKNKLVNYYNN